MPRKSRLAKQGNGKWRRRLSYMSGVTSLAAVPYIVYDPVVGCAVVFGAGMAAAVGGYGAKPPIDKYAGVTTMKELRRCAREHKEELAHPRKKSKEMVK